MDKVHESVKSMWQAYMDSIGEDIQTTEKSYTAWHFCNNEEDADELAELVLKGIKRATASLHKLYEYENEAVPQVGNHSIITAWDGSAKCIIRTKNIDIVPFKDVSEEFAATEGEGDGSLEYWKKGHWKFFTEEAKELGLEYDEDMLVVCEEFEVVYK